MTCMQAFLLGGEPREVKWDREEKEARTGLPKDHITAVGSGLWEPLRGWTAPAGVYPPAPVGLGLGAAGQEGTSTLRWPMCDKHLWLEPSDSQEPQSLQEGSEFWGDVDGTATESATFWSWIWEADDWSGKITDWNHTEFKPDVPLLVCDLGQTI